MPEEFQDRDLTLQIIQKAVANIMNTVNSIDDIMNDQKKTRLFQMVMNFLTQAGIQVNQVFPAEIADAYAAGHDLGESLLQEAGQSDIVGALTTQVHAQAVQAIAIAGVNDMQAAIRTAADFFMGTINQTLETVQTEIGQGILQGNPTREVTKRVQAHFQANGLTAFRTIDGRMLPLDFYSMVVTRTKTRDAHTQGAANRYKENGVDLVRFPIRSHTCHICGARERLVVSLEGKTAGYPTAEEIGGLPPFHPNCRHYPIPVTDASQYPPQSFTGRDMRSQESKDTYKDEQNIRRRANEEKKQYLKMKSEADAAGESFPAIGTWRRMKRKNDAKWKQLQENYRQSIAKIPTTVRTASNVANNGGRIAELQNEIRGVIDSHRQPPIAATLETGLAFRPENTQLFKEWQRQLHEGMGLKDIFANRDNLNTLETMLNREATIPRGFAMSKRLMWDEGALDSFFPEGATMEGIANTFNPNPEKYYVNFDKIKMISSGNFDKPQAEFVMHLHDKETDDPIARIDRLMVKLDDKFIVQNNFFEIEKPYQGQNFARDIYFKSEQLYKHMAGDKKVKIALHANLDVGGYAWTKHGFDFKNEEELIKMQSNLKDNIKWLRKISDSEVDDYIKSKLGYDGLKDIKHSWQMAALDDGELYNGYDGAKLPLGKYSMLGSDWSGVKILDGGEGEKIANLYYQMKGVK